MNSRHYDNVPPVASNTVTIATSSQGRLAPVSQIRSMSAAPMRQPIPIRKNIHDGGGGASTSGSIAPVQYPISHQIKEDPDTLDYQGASTSSGPLIPTSSNSFQQYQRGSGGPSGSSGGSTVTSGALVMNNGINSMAMDQPAPVNLASKVAEVFLTAGHAFQKLGDLTLQLHTTTDADESKWSEKEVDNLKNALTRFAHELDQISTCVANRTTKHIKNDIKRRHMMTEEPTQQVKRMAMSSMGGAGPSGSGTGNYSTMNSSGAISSGHAVPLNQKRMHLGKLLRPMIPSTTRYTVTPMSGSSTLIPSTVVVNSNHQGQSPSPGGMPQLQSQNGPGPSSSSVGPSQQRIVTTTAPVPRVMPSQLMAQGGVKGSGGTAKRVMTPNSGAMSIPASGALILEQND